MEDLISSKTLVLHMLHKNLVTNIICEHKYFRLTGCLHCDPRIFPGTPSYVLTPSAENRSTPSKRRKVSTKKHNELQSE